MAQGKQVLSYKAWLDKVDINLREDFQKSRPVIKAFLLQDHKFNADQIQQPDAKTADLWLGYVETGCMNLFSRSHKNLTIARWNPNGLLYVFWPTHKGYVQMHEYLESLGQTTIGPWQAVGCLRAMVNLLINHGRGPIGATKVIFVTDIKSLQENTFHRIKELL